MKRYKSFLTLVILMLLFSACKKSDLYDAEYEYPTILTIAGSNSVTAGASGFTTKYHTYYLGPNVSLTWSTSAPADVELTPNPDNITEVTIKFKPSAAGKKINILVGSSNGINGSKEVTIN